MVGNNATLQTIATELFEAPVIVLKTENSTQLEVIPTNKIDSSIQRVETTMRYVSSETLK